MFLPPSRAKIKMTTDRDIKDRILNVISIFFFQCFEIIIFLSKATSTDAVAALKEVSVWWTVVVFTQHCATFKNWNHATFYRAMVPQAGKSTYLPHLESIYVDLLSEKTPFWKYSTISQLFGLDDYVTDLFVLFFDFIKIPWKFISHHWGIGCILVLWTK